jgi:glycosyltransferase involved in cell wall biosynthesis
MKPQVSFIITSRDEEPALLASTINGLLATTNQSDREIIVIDDGSSVPVICLQGEIILIRHPEPIGVSRSLRRGAEVASGDIIVWLDAHMTFAPDWLDEMLRYVDSGSLLCSAFWNYEQTVRHCFGARFVWCGERDYMKQHSPGLTFDHLTEFPGSGCVEVPMVIGACYMISRDSYERLGGFSPLFRIWGCNEQDLSARAWLMGVGAKCVTEARVGHFSRTRFPYTVKFDHVEFNQLMLLRTVFEESTIEMLEECFKPIPPLVQEWVNQEDWIAWRKVVQSSRQISDAEFFRRFLPDIPAL